jgi:diaminohydroxyphosphoribosylaminopyrimidine deaminase/5-amino-6-(5-phosphoribosylamino)uracil reductase
MPRDADQEYMSLALRLARKAEGMTSPNPLVGAVIAKGGKILGRGYHRKAGLAHAEIEAFLDAEKQDYNLKGSTLYVTLEPCCHTEKRTPPCVKAITERGISRVVIGSLDPNPRVKGKGAKILRAKGLEIKIGALEEKCMEINEGYFKYIKTGLPFVTLKLAATLDGKIATITGDSKWIGSETQRRYAHNLRKKVDAVVVGVETVLHDNPQLTARLSTKSSHHPRPVVLDSRLRIPIESQLLQTDKSPIIACTPKADPKKIEELQKRGARVLITDMDGNRRVDLSKLLKKLGEMEIMNIMVEGGSKVAASFLTQNLVDKIVFFYSPKIIGAEGTSMIGELGISKVREAFLVRKVRLRTIGEEFVVEGYTSPS